MNDELFMYVCATIGIIILICINIWNKFDKNKLA